MAIDYNKLMEELDSCLGLESSATKSVKRPSGPSKKRKAFEGYDDVDLEIIQAMKDSPEGAPPEFSEEDLVYSEDGSGGDQGMPGVEEGEGDSEESPEIKLADSVDCLFNNYIESGKTPQEAADSIKDLVESAVAELYEPDGDEEVEADEGMEDVVTPVKEVSCHSLANRSAEESIDKSRLEEIYEDFFDEAELGISPSLEEIIKYAKDYLKRQSPEDLKKDFGEYADPVRLAKKMLEMDKIDNGPGGKPISKARLEEIYEDFFDGSGLGPDPDPEDTVEHAKDFYLIGWTPNELKRDFGPYADPELLAKKMLEMHRAYHKAYYEGRPTNRSAEENSKAVDDDPYDPDAAFEALSSKMLNRYSQLTRRNQPKSKKSAEEGVSETEVKIDDNAIRRVSCEFAYSGKNLRKMVAEAIKKGVI